MMLMIVVKNVWSTYSSKSLLELPGREEKNDPIFRIWSHKSCLTLTLKDAEAAEKTKSEKIKF